MNPIIDQICEYLDRRLTYPIGLVLYDMTQPDIEIKIVGIYKDFNEVKNGIYYGDSFLDELPSDFEVCYHEELLDIWENVSPWSEPIEDFRKQVIAKNLKTLLNDVNDYLQNHKLQYDFIYGDDAFDAIENVIETLEEHRRMKYTRRRRFVF